jgi:hypothetical protein
MFIFSSPPFYTQYVRLTVASDPPPSEIRKNPKFYPFFDGAIGAIDDSHISCSCPARERAKLKCKLSKPQGFRVSKLPFCLLI